jgi:hypothetical protein
MRNLGNFIFLYHFINRRNYTTHILVIDLNWLQTNYTFDQFFMRISSEFSSKTSEILCFEWISICLRLKGNKKLKFLKAKVVLIRPKKATKKVGFCLFYNDLLDFWCVLSLNQKKKKNFLLSNVECLHCPHFYQTQKKFKYESFR